MEEPINLWLWSIIQEKTTLYYLLLSLVLVMKYKTGEDNCVLLTFALGGIGDVLGDRVQDKRK